MTEDIRTQIIELTGDIDRAKDVIMELAKALKTLPDIDEDRVAAGAMSISQGFIALRMAVAELAN